MTPADESLRFHPDTFGLEDTIPGQQVGYTRVSTLDQNSDRQLDGVALDRLFTDSASGKDLRRPQFEEMLSFVRDGDTVLVHSMDRLARNLDDLRRIVRTLTARGVRVQFVKEQLTFTGDDTAMATLLLSVMGAFAEFERALIRERQREGIAVAKRNGVYRGRRKSLSSEQIARLHSLASLQRASRRPSWLEISVSAVKPSTSIFALAFQTLEAVVGLTSGQRQAVPSCSRDVMSSLISPYGRT